LALTIHPLHPPPGRAMASSYMAFSLTCSTPPSFSGFQPLGRDKLGLHGIFQPSQQHQLHSLSAADAAHADFSHFTLKTVEPSRYLPPGVVQLVNRPKVRTNQAQSSDVGLKVGTRSISFAADRFGRGRFKARSRNLLCILCLNNEVSSPQSAKNWKSCRTLGPSFLG
jgi:hypothetical protein